MTVRSAPLAAAFVLLAALVAVSGVGGESEDPPPTPAVRDPVVLPWWVSPAVGLGPLAQSSQSPSSVFRLSHPSGTPATLRKGEWEVGSHADWANYFCDGGDRYMLDFESIRWRLSLARGLTARTQVTVVGSVSYQGGGTLDGFIEGFERSVGAINRDRQRAPRDRYLLRVRGADGSIYEYQGRDSGWHGENLSFELKHQMLPGSETTPSLAVRAIVKVPVGSHVSGRPEGGLDAGVSLDAGGRLGRFHLYGSLGAVGFQRASSTGSDLPRYQLSLLGAVEYRATPRTSLVMQMLVSGPVAYHLGELSDRTREQALGVKHRLGRDLLVELSVVENVLVFSNSADVAFHLGLAWRPGLGRWGAQAQPTR